MAVRRLTRGESRQGRTHLREARAAEGYTRLEWLIDFERCDVSTLGKEDLIAIRQRLGRFTSVRDGDVLPVEVLSGSKTASASRIPRLSRKVIADIQKNLRALFTLIRPPDQTPSMPPIRVRIEARTQGVDVVAFGSGQIDSVHAAVWPDILWLAIIALLQEHGTKIRRCGARTGATRCGTLFLRSRRQTFCSKACSQRERARRWYERHGSEVRRQRRAAYRKTGR